MAVTDSVSVFAEGTFEEQASNIFIVIYPCFQTYAPRSKNLSTISFGLNLKKTVLPLFAPSKMRSRSTKVRNH